MTIHPARPGNIHPMTHKSHRQFGLRLLFHVPVMLIFWHINLTAALVHNGGQSPLLATTPTLLSPSAPPSAVCPTPVDPAGLPKAFVDQHLQSEIEHTERVSPSNQTYHYQQDLSQELNTTSDRVALETNASAAEYQMKCATKGTIGVLATLISYISVNSIVRAVNPDLFIWCAEDRENDEWISTSNSWLDRKACRWLGVCGLAHIHTIGPHFGKRITRPPENSTQPLDEDWDWKHAWSDGKDRPEDLTDDARVLREIPDYVLEYAPLVHLYSEEQFWPCDIAEHLYHVTPTLNYTPVETEWQHPTLQNLHELNRWDHGRFVFLTSNDNVEERPEWLEGKENIPSAPHEETSEDLTHFPGRSFSSDLHDSYEHIKEWFQSGPEQPPDRFSEFNDPHASVDEPLHLELKRSVQEPPSLHHLRGGRSNAPAVLIAVNKGHGIVDAFWFFFYSFNLGNTVFNVRFGNHVGDWEHSMVRFHKGKPKAVYFSEHSWGSAYGYDAVEKIGKRPIVYSARGTHAMYSTPGLQPYVLPWGILHDTTDRGPLWDPVLNSHSYTYDYKNDILRASNLSPEAPTSWFHYTGHWGDKFYPLNDKRQYSVVGQYHYVNGPTGPKFKHLGRRKVCAGPDSAPCVIKHWLGGVNRIQRWHGVGEGDNLSPEDLEKMIIRDPK